MNILITVPWDQRGGGVGSVVANLGKYLEGRGHRVYFFHPGKAFRLEQGTTRRGFHGFKLRLVAPFSFRRPILSTLAFPILFPLTLLQLLRMIRRHNIGVVNVHYPTDAFGFFALCRKLVPIRLVTSIHGADIFPKGQPRKRYGAFCKFLLNGSDLIVANSEAFRKDFLSVFPALEKKTVAIYNGVNLDDLNEPIRQGYRKNGRRYLLSVAMHNEKKGLDVLIRAFSQIAAHDRKLELVLVGDGDLRKNLEDLAISLGLREQVRFLGRRDHEEVARLIHGCELFVHPAISEPFGIAVTEALACRKPVVASKVGGIPEIIEDGRSGILVEPAKPERLAEAISMLLADPQAADRMAEQGYLTVTQKFLWANTGKNYEQTFKNLRSDL